jgi:methionyl-tRNA formyltransferase
MKILRARAGEGAAEPGAVIAGGRNEAGVGTGDGVLWLEEAQLAGKKATPMAAFLAGARGFVGSKLE